MGNLNQDQQKVILQNSCSILEWNTQALKNTKIVTDLFAGIRKLLHHNYFQFLRTLEGLVGVELKEEQKEKEKELLVKLKTNPRSVSRVN